MKYNVNKIEKHLKNIDTYLDDINDKNILYGVDSYINETSNIDEIINMNMLDKTNIPLLYALFCISFIVNMYTIDNKTDDIQLTIYDPD